MIERATGVILDGAGVDLLGAVAITIEHYEVGIAIKGWRGGFKVPRLKRLPVGTYTIRLTDGREGQIITVRIDVGGGNVAFQGSGPLARIA